MNEDQHYKPFTDLEAWKISRKLKKKIFELIKIFPEEEKFELSRQLRRSARSTPTNIAEGHGRYTYKDQYNFCVIARGSLMETFNHLIDAYDCNYIGKEQLSELKQEIDEAGKVLNGYMTFLKSKFQ